MKLHYQNAAFNLPVSTQETRKKFLTTELLLKSTPILTILITAIITQTWVILFTLLYVPAQSLIRGLQFMFDLSNIDINYEDIIGDLESM